MIFLAIELLGTVSFALSGAVSGVRRRFDLFGVMILALTTACGGGVIRDLILENTPPLMFRKPVYAVTAMLTSLVVFLPAVRRLLEKYHKAYDVAMLLTDSVGLGLFTVVGVQTAAELYGGSGIFLRLFVGVVTGCGGGVLRDIFVGQTPQIFVKHFYACASLVGAAVYLLVRSCSDALLATILGAACVIALRCLAAYFHWNLPRVEDPDF